MTKPKRTPANTNIDTTRRRLLTIVAGGAFEFEYAEGCPGDAHETMKWIDAFLNTIAEAAGDILTRQAVRS